MPKEQVFEDLFNAVDTPYWRLKKIMDAWCALWFWPAEKADSAGRHRPGVRDADRGRRCGWPWAALGTCRRLEPAVAARDGSGAGGFRDAAVR